MLMVIFQKSLLTTLVGFSIVFVLGIGSRANAAIAEQSTGATKDGSEFLQKLCDSACNWNDYSCQTDLETFKSDKPSHSGCRFFYKKGRVRIEIMGSGFRSGSVVVKQKDGSVRVRSGPLLGGLAMNLDPDSRMLILPSGLNATKSDIPDLLVSLREQLSRGYTCRVTIGPVQKSDIPGMVFVLEIFEPNASSTTPYKRIFVAADNKLPVRWETYRDGRLFCSASFSNMRTNQGLQDDLFKL